VGGEHIALHARKTRLSLDVEILEGKGRDSRFLHNDIAHRWRSSAHASGVSVRPRGLYTPIHPAPVYSLKRGGSLRLV